MFCMAKYCSPYYSLFLVKECSYAEQSNIINQVIKITTKYYQIELINYVET